MKFKDDLNQFLCLNVSFFFDDIADECNLHFSVSVITFIFWFKPLLLDTIEQNYTHNFTKRLQV